MKKQKIKTFEDAKSTLLRINYFIASLQFENHLDTNDYIDYQIETTKILTTLMNRIEYLESKAK